MTLKKYKQIFEALDNERRLELFEYLLQKIFISKSELAKKFDLSRASLNHHLNIMLKAGLIFENGLILDGRKQFFITPAISLHPDQFVEQKEEYQHLSEQLEEWTKRNLTIDTWRILKEELKRLDVPQTIVDAVEERLFPSLVKRAPTTRELCYFCRTEEAQTSCHTCKNFICKTHIHEIKREGEEMITLCPNCVEKFFG
ncbi:MAG: helix-turn-helix transcriptional regulator [Candidatus Heimdallarchaeota archaeon]|nr:MAG: helix-turn-helix transcriptional regulator [Candidatus Heimdallarchaeota archaeon]